MHGKSTSPRACRSTRWTASMSLVPIPRPIVGVLVPGPIVRVGLSSQSNTQHPGGADAAEVVPLPSFWSKMALAGSLALCKSSKPCRTCPRYWPCVPPGSASHVSHLRIVWRGDMPSRESRERLLTAVCLPAPSHSRLVLSQPCILVVIFGSVCCVPGGTPGAP